MGMSASQARFLGLTARKSNVEYEGQQVNQQRTNLANQTAILNNQMLALEVPIPPDVNQFYNEMYVFTDGDKKCEIVSGLGRDTITVSETDSQYDVYSQKCNLGSPVTLTMLEGELSLNNHKMTLLNAESSRAQIRTILNGGHAGNEPPFMCSFLDKNSFKAVTDDESVIKDTEKTKYINKLDKVQFPLTDDSDFETNFKAGVPTYYMEKDEDGNCVYTQVTEENYDAIMVLANDDVVDFEVYQESRDDNNEPVKVALSQEEAENTKGLELYTGESKFVELTQELWNEAKEAGNEELMNYYIENLDFTSQYASNNQLYYYTKDSCVRYIQKSFTDSVQNEGDAGQFVINQEYYEQCYKNTINNVYSNCLWNKESSGRYSSVTAKDPSGTVKTFSLQFTKVQDEAAYEQAMQEYEYKKAQYEKAVSDINAKTSTIQQQDKTLELRLKSLDTEQEALTKEMEAVKKVINNNVENTFNTFS